MCDHYPILRKSVSLDDFGDVEANFLNHIDEEFENQLCHYAELIDICCANTYRHTTYMVDIPYSHTHINP